MTDFSLKYTLHFTTGTEKSAMFYRPGRHQNSSNKIFFFFSYLGCLCVSLNCHKNLWRQWHSTPVLLPGKSHGRRSLLGCNPWGQSLRVGHDWATSLSLSCIGEGNGNPLQCYCLENPRDGAAWWAAVYGVTQSRTRLRWLSSNSICFHYL